MIEIRCIVADKRLADALRAIDPFALEPPAIKVGVAPLNGAASGAGPTSDRRVRATANQGRHIDILDAYVAKGRGTQFTATEVAQKCEAAGLPKYGYWYGLSKLIKAKKVKKVGEKEYEVL